MIAIGPHHLLTVDATPGWSAAGSSSTRSGHRRRIGPTSFTDAAAGTISRTGRYAALTESGATATLGWDRVTIIDLDTAATIASFDPKYLQQDAQSLIRLPDNRLLGLRDGRIYLLDPATKHFTTPNLRIPGRLIQLATRPNP